MCHDNKAKDIEDIIPIHTNRNIPSGNNRQGVVAIKKTEQKTTRHGIITLQVKIFRERLHFVTA
jgi:hypothetical protein